VASIAHSCSLQLSQKYDKHFWVVITVVWWQFTVSSYRGLFTVSRNMILISKLLDPAVKQRDDEEENAAG